MLPSEIYIDKDGNATVIGLEAHKLYFSWGCKIPKEIISRAKKGERFQIENVSIKPA